MAHSLSGFITVRLVCQSMFVSQSVIVIRRMHVVFDQVMRIVNGSRYVGAIIPAQMEVRAAIAFADMWPGLPDSDSSEHGDSEEALFAPSGESSASGAEHIAPPSGGQSDKSCHSDSGNSAGSVKPLEDSTWQDVVGNALDLYDAEIGLQGEGSDAICKLECLIAHVSDIRR